MNSNTVKRQVAINEFAWMIVVTILIGLGPHSVGAQEKDQAKQGQLSGPGSPQRRRGHGPSYQNDRGDRRLMTR